VRGIGERSHAAIEEEKAERKVEAVALELGIAPEAPDVARGEDVLAAEGARAGAAADTTHTCCRG